jgi:hypothetical protein
LLSQETELIEPVRVDYPVLHLIAEEKQIAPPGGPQLDPSTGKPCIAVGLRSKIQPFKTVRSQELHQSIQLSPTLAQDGFILSGPDRPTHPASR